MSEAAGSTTTMSTSCEVHGFDYAVGTCRSCLRNYCAECLVWSHGEDKPPFCIPCALAASGVRKGGGRKPVQRASGSAGRVVVGLTMLASGGAVAATAVTLL